MDNILVKSASFCAPISEALIWDNDALVDLMGLSNTTFIGQLRIFDNASLLNLDGLASMTSLEELEVYGNDVLSDVDGLNGITEANSLATTTRPWARRTSMHWSHT